jgi:hypothetical protein
MQLQTFASAVGKHIDKLDNVLHRDEIAARESLTTSWFAKLTRRC